MLKKFLTIVPGDVIYYGHTHIGEIANVDYDMVRNATTINQLLQAITVIECVYNGSVNFVIKRSMLGGSTVPFPDLSSPDAGKQPQLYSWQFYKAKDVDNLRKWEIRRLK